MAGSYPARVLAQTSGRIKILTTSLSEGQETVSLESDKLTLEDPAKGNYYQVATGIAIAGLPQGWSVYLPRDGNVRVTSPGGLQADLRAMADQGDTLSRTFGGSSGQTYGGAPAWIQSWGTTTRIWAHSRRRFVEVSISGGSPAEQKQLEAALAPTFAAK